MKENIRVALIGSCGDGRHILATLHDFILRKKGAVTSKTTTTKHQSISSSNLLIDVVDWQEEVCARSLIICTFILAWGITRTRKGMRIHQAEVFELLWFLMISPGVPKTLPPLIDIVIDSLCAILTSSTPVLEQKRQSSESSSSNGKASVLPQLMKEAAQILIEKNFFTVTTGKDQVIAAMKRWKK